ncbi:hypothetical protein SEVIR_9G440401v4 [Setaria viridis]
MNFEIVQNLRQHKQVGRARCPSGSCCARRPWRAGCSSGGRCSCRCSLPTCRSSASCTPSPASSGSAARSPASSSSPSSLVGHLSDRIAPRASPLGRRRSFITAWPATANDAALRIATSRRCCCMLAFSYCIFFLQFV